jgi:glycine amidinotransferase
MEKNIRNNSSKEIYVESEFAPLKIVVLTQSQLKLPDVDAFTPEQLSKETSILPPLERANVMKLFGHDMADIFPERQLRWEAEREALKQVLEKYGIEVLRPKLLTQYEKEAGGKMGYSNSFVRDPWFTVGGHVVEGSLRFPQRRKEVLPCRTIFQDVVFPADCNYVAVPQPDIFPLEVDGGGPGPFLEGGDVLVYGKHIFVGNSGRASTVLGAEFLRKLLTPDGYTVEIVRLKPTILHLDCAMGLIREGLLVVYEDGLLDGIPSVLKNWEKIYVSEKESMSLGTNGLPLSPSVYVADPVFKRIGNEIAQRGITVEYVDFTISRSLGGAFRCSTQALLRV